MSEELVLLRNLLTQRHTQTTTSPIRNKNEARKHKTKVEPESLRCPGQPERPACYTLYYIILYYTLLTILCYVI